MIALWQWVRYHWHLSHIYDRARADELAAHVLACDGYLSQKEFERIGAEILEDEESAAGALRARIYHA